MASLRRALYVLIGTLGAGVAGAGLAAGCGSGDDSTSQPPLNDASVGDGAHPTGDGGGNDSATIDAQTNDALASDGGAKDGASQDATSQDATVPDGNAPDSGADAPLADASSDVGSASDGDGGPLDAASNDAAALMAFPGQLAEAYCSKLASCCFGADAAAFDIPRCVSNTLPYGYGETLLGALQLLDSGILTLDPAKAQACLNDIGAIDCTANVLTAQAHLATLGDCLGAVQGTIPANRACTSSVACAGNQYCAIAADASTGTCTPLSGQGGSCDYRTLLLSETACSARGTGNTGLRCVNQNTEAPYQVYDAATWTCGPTLAADASCNTNQDCQSQLCDTSNPNVYLCTSAETFGTPSTCAFYTRDGG